MTTKILEPKKINKLLDFYLIRLQGVFLSAFIKKFRITMNFLESK